MKHKGAVCINEGLLFYIGGIINTIADALITVLPIPLIMRLQMPKHEQIGVIVLLSLGFFVTLAGVIRTYYIWLAQVHTQDETWWSYPLFVAATVEVDIGIVSVVHNRHHHRLKLNCRPGMCLYTYHSPFVHAILQVLQIIQLDCSFAYWHDSS